jgi:hypothetical protein
MLKESEEIGLTDEQRKEVIRIRDYLVNIIAFEVSHGGEGTERKRFARMFLEEAMEKAGHA